MLESKIFPLIDVVSLATDRLFSKSVDRIYELCSFMLSAEIFTSQLPGAMRICRMEIQLRYPELKQLMEMETTDALKWLEKHPTQQLAIQKIDSETLLKNPIKAFADIKESEDRYSQDLQN